MTRPRSVAVFALLATVLCSRPPPRPPTWSGVEVETPGRRRGRGRLWSRRSLRGGWPGWSTSRSTPRTPANRIVSDIDLAPRNERGAGGVPVELLPAEAEGRPRAATAPFLYEVSNRGGKGMLGYFNNAAGSRDPRTAAEMGDGFLLENGSLAARGSAGSSTCRSATARCGCTRRVATDGGNPNHGACAERGDRQRARLRSLARGPEATSPTRWPIRTIPATS